MPHHRAARLSKRYRWSNFYETQRRLGKCAAFGADLRRLIRLFFDRLTGFLNVASESLGRFTGDKTQSGNCGKSDFQHFYIPFNIAWYERPE